jgi:phage terminase small subunit
MVKLTDKQEKFVQELIKGKSQREAYREAYPGSKKWTDNSIDARASRLFKSDKVLTRYNEIHDKMIAEAEAECIFDGKRILKELAKIAFADRTGFAEVVTEPKLIRRWDKDLDKYVYEESKTQFEQYVRIKDTDQLTDNQKAVVSGIKNTRHGISVETYDKQAALMALGKAAGIFVDRMEIIEQKKDPFEDMSEEDLMKLADYADDEE